ncbi:MAG: hypothetical protein KTR28_04825 [Micavibrio sp.]|nr:hypothetical protein [Micavibrio sp.]
MRNVVLFLLFVFVAFVPVDAYAGLREKFHGLCLEKRYPPNADAAFCGCMTGKPFDDFINHLQYGASNKKSDQQKEMLATIIKEPGMSESRVEKLCNLYEMQFAPASPAAAKATDEIHKTIQNLKAEYSGGSIGQGMIQSMMVQGYCRVAYDAKKLSQKAGAVDSSVYDTSLCENLPPPSYLSQDHGINIMF